LYARYANELILSETLPQLITPFYYRHHHQPTTAWALKKVWPEITLHIVPDAGHSSRELGITKLLVEVRRFQPLLLS